MDTPEKHTENQKVQPAMSTTQQCRFDAQCHVLQCSMQHSVGICGRPRNCEDFYCSKRHLKSRKGACRNVMTEKPCTYGESCKFLHPKVNANSNETGENLSKQTRGKGRNRRGRERGAEQPEVGIAHADAPNEVGGDVNHIRGNNHRGRGNNVMKSQPQPQPQPNPIPTSKPISKPAPKPKPKSKKNILKPLPISKMSRSHPKTPDEFVARLLSGQGNRTRSKKSNRERDNKLSQHHEVSYSEDDVMSVEIITDMQRLLAVIDELSREPCIFMDTEFVPERYYWPRLCLLQVCSKVSPAYLIDTIVLDADTVFERFEPIFENQNIIKVFHAGQEDFRILINALPNLQPRSFFDTSIGIEYCTSDERVTSGFAAVAKHLLNVTIEKGAQRSDWEGKLTDRQIKYAAGDVYFLRLIYDTMMSMIRDGPLPDKKLVWITNSTHEMFDKARMPRNRAKLTKEELALADKYDISQNRLNEAIDWREDFCRKHNLPRNAVQPKTMFEAMLQNPADRNGILSLVFDELLDEYKKTASLTDTPKQTRSKPTKWKSARMEFCKTLKLEAQKYMMRTSCLITESEFRELYQQNGKLAPDFFRVPTVLPLFDEWLPEWEETQKRKKKAREEKEKEKNNSNLSKDGVDVDE